MGDPERVPVSTRRTVALVGLPCSGKSTLAPLLATGLGLGLVDLDERIEQLGGRTVGQVFDSEGEQGFRRRELDALRDVLSGEAVVLSTGGGVVTTDAARALLASDCQVVWLTADLEELVRRAEASSTPRPLLAADVATSLRTLHREREALYREVADLRVEVDDLEPHEIAARIIEELGSAPGDP